MDLDHSRVIVHVDLDCFYAQVEMIKNPSLTEVPLGIQQKNIVVTSNYVARTYGIKKCMLVTEAQKLCPTLVLVKGEDLHDYRQISYKVTELLQTYSDAVERLGLDENFVDITNLTNERLQSGGQGNEKIIGNIFGDTTEMCQCGCEVRLKVGSRIAQEMREKLKENLGLTSCAGIAHNKLLAKLVGAKHKPNQQSLVFPNNAPELMLSLGDVLKIPGVGRAVGEQLGLVGIRTIHELQNANILRVNKALGVEKAKIIQEMSFGIDKSPVKSSGKPQSIGLEDSCKSISVEKEVREKLVQLLHRLLVLVHEDGRLPRTIKLTVRKFDKGTKTSHRETRQSNLNPSLFNSQNVSSVSESSEQKLMNIIMHLFSRLVDENKPYHITLLGLSFTKFNEKPNVKNSMMSYIRKNLEVQSVTSIENIQELEEFQSEPSTSKCLEGSESEVEPSPKKTKLTALDKLKASGNEECISPSKLRVAELRLNSIETCANNQNVNCPPDADEEVFKELPLDVQKEVWENYKRSRRDSESNVGGSQSKKSKPNTLLNYFVRK